MEVLTDHRTKNFSYSDGSSGIFAFVKNKFTFTSRTVTKNSCKKFFRIFCLFLILKITIFACFQFIFFFHHFINNNFSFIFAYRKKEKYFYVILCYVDVGAFQIYLRRWGGSGHKQVISTFRLLPSIYFSQCLPIVITVGKRIKFDSRKIFYLWLKEVPELTSPTKLPASMIFSIKHRKQVSFDTFVFLLLSDWVLITNHLRMQNWKRLA